MKKIFLLASLFVMAGLGVNAQDEDLQPTKLGKWSRPAKTSIAAVDTYIEACANFYQEAMDIRAQFDAIQTSTDDVIDAANAALGAESEIAKKKAALDAVIARIEKQQEPGTKLGDLAVAATNSLGSAGLKAIAGTKAIASTKEAIKLAIAENAAVLKAATTKVAALAGK